MTFLCVLWCAGDKYNAILSRNFPQKPAMEALLTMTSSIFPTFQQFLWVTARFCVCKKALQWVYLMPFKAT